MMKAVLVIDMPEFCSDCMFRKEDKSDDIWEFKEYKCMFTKRNAEGKPNIDCPLKILPVKQSGADLYDEYESGYEDGWNAFRKEIIGE